MIISRSSIPDVLLIAPTVFSDERGFFWESFNERQFFEQAGINASFVQDNHTTSVKGVLRGLHYQIRQPQGKLVRVVAGEVFDVAVDLRKSSPTFGHWTSTALSAENKIQLWIPAGFAHGFFVKSEIAEVLYKVSDYYAPQHERTILWNDPALDIDWPLEGPPLLSAKDRTAKLLRDADVFV